MAEFGPAHRADLLGAVDVLPRSHDRHGPEDHLADDLAVLEDAALWQVLAQGRGDAGHLLLEHLDGAGVDVVDRHDESHSYLLPLRLPGA
ncbi:hypothetical protein SDC9_189026 [bioreactor metagenome]|uniref:Uncharacterized protein n=1 Tax=bioreactor metagenome TaxID=1076179 RepID=A0A645HRJ1_9ZZZZ